MKNNWHQKIGIGTVQFGLDYGISNTQGKVRSEEVAKILQFAQEKGIQTLDTARAYGNSEEVLGSFLENTNDFQIVSKLSAGLEEVEEEIRQSLAYLKQDSLYAYLFHDFTDFEKNPKFWEDLQKARASGKVQKIGFSLYYPTQVETLWQKNIDFDILQIPYNLFDRRFEPYLEKLKSQNVEIHIRSVFLQGLFFIKNQELSTHFDTVKPKITQLQQITQEQNLSLASLPLFFVLQNPNIDKAILGLNSLKDLQENIKVLEQFDKIQELNIDFSGFKEEDEKIILPFLWEK